MSHLELVALVVRDYDAAIRFFVDILQFELIEDTPALTEDGRPKRWGVVRPGEGQTGILLARADGGRQTELVGQQFAGRVGLFLRVDDFDAAYDRMLTAGVRALHGQLQARVLTRVRTFAAFDSDNDPYGEHDFGSFAIDGETYFWKIDCYDPDLRFGSPDPADPGQTRRILTVMLAEEY